MLIRKLEIFAPLAERDRRALQRLSEGAHSYRAGEDLIEEGSPPECVFLLTQGWACRYKLLPDGQRQILGYMLPGDTGDIFNFVIETMDHSISALGPCKAVSISQTDLLDVVARHPAIARALYWAALVDGATNREWLLNIGQRDGFGRAAHLFSELLLRMGSIGLAAGDSFSLPLTQTDLADTMGLTPVYVNRTLQRMRAEKLITLSRRELTILEPERLIKLSAFTPNYLHLGGSAEQSRTLRPDAPRIGEERTGISLCSILV